MHCMKRKWKSSCGCLRWKSVINTHLKYCRYYFRHLSTVTSQNRYIYASPSCGSITSCCNCLVLCLYSMEMNIDFKKEGYHFAISVQLIVSVVCTFLFVPSDNFQQHPAFQWQSSDQPMNCGSCPANTLIPPCFMRHSIVQHNSLGYWDGVDLCYSCHLTCIKWRNAKQCKQCKLHTQEDGVDGWETGSDLLPVVNIGYF